jgi:hypothetical protein
MSPFDTSIRAAIFLEDFKVTSESPHTRFSICVRPYSDGMGFGDLNVSAIMDVIAQSCGSYLRKACLKKMLIVYFPFLSNRQTFIPEKAVL